MIRIIAKLFAVTIIINAFLHVAPAFATQPFVVYISSIGNDSNPCTASLPCSTFLVASAALGDALNSGGEVTCLNSPNVADGGEGYGGSYSFTIDCSGFDTVNANDTALTFANNGIIGTNSTITIRHL